MRYRAVIFDLYGTLAPLYTPRRAQDTLFAMADTLGAPRDDYFLMWNYETLIPQGLGLFPTDQATITFICHALGISAAPAQIDAAVRLWHDFQRRILAPLPDAVPVLRQITAAGRTLGLITNRGPAVPALWAETPFAVLIAHPIFSCAVGVRKPLPRIYRLACERLALAPDDCLYIGDGSASEMAGAQAAGLHPALIRVPLEGTFDAHQRDVAAWQGRAIDRLQDVLTLLE